jgi:hypothetical protein
MSHLHNINLISDAVKDQFDRLKDDYGFEDYEDLKIGNDSRNIAICLNEVIINAYINVREGLRILYRRKNWPDYKSHDFMSFLGLRFGNDFAKRDSFLSGSLTPTENFSYEYYSNLLAKEFEFVEKYYPNVFSKGILDMF